MHYAYLSAPTHLKKHQEREAEIRLAPRGANGGIFASNFSEGRCHTPRISTRRSIVCEPVTCPSLDAVCTLNVVLRPCIREGKVPPPLIWAPTPIFTLARAPS